MFLYLTKEYDVFGNEQNRQDEDTNPFCYAEECWDAETGNIYLRNRYYDASIGRFITEAPVRSGLDWYIYAGNNPVEYLNYQIKNMKEPYQINFYISFKFKYFSRHQ